MPPFPPYHIHYHPQDHNLPPYILPLVTSQEEIPPLRRPYRSNVWHRRVNNNRTYVRPGAHHHPYAPPQQRRYNYNRYNYNRVEDDHSGYSEPQYFYIPGDTDHVDIEFDSGTEFELTLYGCTPDEVEVAITDLDAPDDAPAAAAADDDDDDEVEDCCICLDWMRAEDSANPTAELPCGHIFHGDCIMKWLCDGDHNTCPVCRFELPPEE